MTIEVNFVNPNNWGQIYDADIFATIVNSDPPSHNPILPVTVPIIMSVFSLAIYVTTQNPKPRWKFAGTAYAKIQTGIMQGGQFESIIASRALFLNQLNIVRFPQLAPSYKLEFQVPIWFKSFSYAVWGYSGEGFPDLEGKIDYVSAQIQNLGL